MKKYCKAGISLIVLVITIIVILILASAIIISIIQGGLLDNAKKSNFMSDFRSVEEAVNLYSISKIDTSDTASVQLPLDGKLSLSDKQDITNNVPTLQIKIEELNPGKTIENIDLYWIDESVIGIQNIPSHKQEKGYIIDVATKQIYDYVGDKFEGKRWHTLDGGVVEIGLVTPPKETAEMWDGWIKLTLFYPASSTDKKWRLGSEGELRADPMLMWQNYTGPISIPLERTKDVWIKYKLDNKEVVVPPAGTVLVDIVPDKTGTTKVDKVNVNINYDEAAEVKEYRIGNSGWFTYTEGFTVTENCIIEARAKKTENVYNTDGTLLLTRDIAGSDLVYIGNIGTTVIQPTLPPPVITRLAPTGEEKARVQITYPDDAVQKVYTINYGTEENYTSEIDVQNFGTYIIAYYFDASGKKSTSTSILINDTTTGTPPNVPTSHEPLPPYNPTEPPIYDPKTTVDLVAPTITRLAAVGTEKARVSVTYPGSAVSKIYTRNYGSEQDYSSDLVVNEWGTFIMAYYYDANGNKSKVSYIRINEIPTPSETFPEPPFAESILIAPTININPSSGIVSSVTVSLSSPASATTTYIKLGRYGNYEEYTSSIVVRDNLEIYAYYKTSDGKQSQEARARITNIKQPGDTNPAASKPYVYIDAVVYPWSGTFGQDDVNVTIVYSDANKIEYSEDGVIYQPYTVPFKVTENKRIYARGTNANGVTETYLDITNIGKLTPPKTIEKLAVNINVNPEPSLSEVKVAKATVSIEYDSKATEKYYKIGASGDLTEYTGSFEIDKSSTVYAYAKAPDSLGQTSKTIDNIIDGISDPAIVATPTKLTQSSKVAIKVEYDKYATIKRYSIDGGTLRDYTGEFEVTKNGTKIYAYSQNVKGQISSSSYTIENIVPKPPVLALDKGNYYLLKLSYPEGSNGREYKWTANGVWSGYKEAGILLIKPQFKNEVIVNGTLIKIEDENGKLVTFTGDYYLIDVPISELSENISMRWDRVAASAPQIVLDTTNPAMQVVATIIYGETLVEKQYRVLEQGGQLGDWQDYKSPITINRNNSIIYSRGMDESEVWSAEGMYKVTNIDENSPVIALTADLDTALQKVSVKVSVTDDVEVGKVKWASGVQGESYFINTGTEVANNSLVNITSNGYYTFYAEDKVGNKQVYTLNITNVDLTAPIIDIQVTPENTVGLSGNVTINYGDSTVKQYKIGTSNATWTNYTVPFAISSYTILANKWQNADGTVTIYAKGKDTALNEVTVQKKVVSLDLDRPISPVIQANSGYASLTPYGVEYDASASIVYDTRTDIDNLYSIDNGVTWKNYTGQFEMLSGTIIAKSMKKYTGLEVTVSKTVALPSDAIKKEAYDGNFNTYFSANGYMKISPDLQNTTIRVKWSSGTQTTGGSPWNYFGSTISFRNNVNAEISKITTPSGQKTNTTEPIYDNTYTIPFGTEKIYFLPGYSDLNGKLYEIQLVNEPTFTATNGYMMLHADPSKIVNKSYQNITINYYKTSVQKLYKIGTGTEWLNYNDQPIRVEHGQTIYAKGIDQYGNESRIVPSYTSNSSDAVGYQAMDNNDTTYINIYNKLVQLDSSVQSNTIRIKGSNTSISFLNSSKQLISQLSGINDGVYTVPANASWIMGTNNTNVYEIQVSNEPKITAVNEYMLMHVDPLLAIKDPYQIITINYFPTSVQKLYRIGTTGSWLTYNNQKIKLNQGLTIYAKGIDQYGNETRIITSYTSNSTDGVKKEAYDGNFSTYFSGSGYIRVDSSMQRRNVRIKWSSGTQTTGGSPWNYFGSTISFRDINNNEISKITTPSGQKSNTSEPLYDSTYLIPSGTVKMYFVSGNSDFMGRLYEIQLLP